MDKLRLTSLDMIVKFISFDTTSRESNLPLIHFVRDYLAGLGVEAHLTYDETGRKANLFATLGPADRPGIVLSGHTDVVPVDGQHWTTNPFEATLRGDRLLGRGVVDMKGFCAIALAMAPEFLRRGLRTPIHYAFTFDEEVGCLGVPRLIEDLKARGIAPVACIVGEPTSMKVVSAHKGKIGCHVVVRGLEAHTGVAHKGVNAIEAAAEAIAFLRSVARRLRDRGPHAPEFDPPYTTIQTGLIAGGTAVNIVPASCEFDFDIRYLPGTDPRALVEEVKRFVAERVVPEMQAVAPQAGFTWQEVPGCAALNAADDSEAVRLAEALSGESGTLKVGFGTDGGHFQDAGIPTVVCGPGSVDQAHKPDEFITLDQVARCEAFMRRLMEQVCDR